VGGFGLHSKYVCEISLVPPHIWFLLLGSMASLGSKVDSGPSQALSEALEVVQLMQQRLQKTNARLLKVEEATKSITNTHKKIDAKLDGLYKLLQQCNSPSEFSNMEKPHHPFPIQQIHHTLLTADELAYLKKQEVVKILLHRDPPPLVCIPLPMIPMHLHHCHSIYLTNTILLILVLCMPSLIQTHHPYKHLHRHTSTELNQTCTPITNTLYNNHSFTYQKPNPTTIIPLASLLPGSN
jgi:hypothetical protein